MVNGCDKDACVVSRCEAIARVVNRCARRGQQVRKAWSTGAQGVVNRCGKSQIQLVFTLVVNLCPISPDLPDLPKGGERERAGRRAFRWRYAPSGSSSTNRVLSCSTVNRRALIRLRPPRCRRPDHAKSTAGAAVEAGAHQGHYCRGPVKSRGRSAHPPGIVAVVWRVADPGLGQSDRSPVPRWVTRPTPPRTVTRPSAEPGLSGSRKSTWNPLDGHIPGLNDWAVGDNGARFGFKPEPVVFQADDQLVLWTRSTAARERWIQAGMIASWSAQGRGQRRAGDPGDDQRNIGNLGEDRRAAAERDRRGCSTSSGIHANPVDLVERTRRPHGEGLPPDPMCQVPRS